MDYKILQKIVCVSLLSGSLLFSNAVNAAVVTNRVPLLGYCEHVIPMYKAPNVTAGIALNKETFIQIRSLRLMNGTYWGYGAFPVSRGKVVNGWLKMSDLQNVSFNNYDGIMTSAQSVYRIPDNIGTYNGAVETGEIVLVVGSQGNLLQIIYKQKNSNNYRIGWVVASAVQNTQATTAPVTQNKPSANTTASANSNAGKLVLVEHPVLTQTTNSGASTSSNRTTVNSDTINKNPVINSAPQRNRMKGDFDGDGKIGMTDVSKINCHVIGLEMLPQGDLKIADINEDGKIDEDDVAIVKNVNNGMDSISNYKTNYSRWSKVAARTVPAYNEPSLKQKRDRNVNERVDKGDNVTVYSETGNAYYVEYPAGNVKKKRWVSKDVFTEEKNTTVTTNTTKAVAQGISSATTNTKQPAQGVNAGTSATKQTVQGTSTGATAATQAALQQKQQQNQTLKIVYPSNGYYSLQPMCAPNTELTVQGAGTAQGTNVCISAIGSDRQTAKSHQKWFIERIGNTEWYKILAENSGYAMNIHNGTAADWTNVSIWPYGGTMHQFRFLDCGGGYYVIQGNVAGTYVLDVYYGGSASGTNVQIYGFNNTASQKWKLVKRNAAAVQPIPAFKQFTATAKRTVNAYENSALTNWDGKSRVDYNDTITVTKEEGNSYFVHYPIKTAPYYKEKWVTKDVLKEEPKPVLADVQSKLMYEVYRTIKGPKITCDFDGYVNTKGRHEGIDMSLYHKAPVYATISGEITKAGGDKFNTFAIYDKANNKTVVYLHFYSVATGLRVGNFVNKGTLIGYQGSSGASASHVHIEVRNNRVAGAAKSVDDPTLDNPNPYSYWNSVL